MLRISLNRKVSSSHSDLVGVVVVAAEADVVASSA